VDPVGADPHDVGAVAAGPGVELDGRDPLPQCFRVAVDGVVQGEYDWLPADGDDQAANVLAAPGEQGD
jgi:hypothetical protein